MGDTAARTAFRDALDMLTDLTVGVVSVKLRAECARSRLILLLAVACQSRVTRQCERPEWAARSKKRAQWLLRRSRRFGARQPAPGPRRCRRIAPSSSWNL